MGRDFISAAMSVKLQHFNPRAPRGARRPSATSCTWCTTFQSTRPCGARHNVFTADDVLFTISIHAPVWGATGTNSILLLPHSHFNPRARVGRDAYSLENSNDTLISIHAPAWGATLEFQIRLFAVGISIHAPAWGATVPVYTGLITAVALYFSRTSFSAVLLQAFFVAKSSV